VQSVVVLGVLVVLQIRLHRLGVNHVLHAIGDGQALGFADKPGEGTRRRADEGKGALENDEEREPRQYLAADPGRDPDHDGVNDQLENVEREERKDTLHQQQGQVGESQRRSALPNEAQRAAQVAYLL